MRFFALALVAAVSGTSLRKNFLKKSMDAPAAGEVFISDTKVFGAGASGSGGEMGCNDVSGADQNSKTAPRIKVCGTNIKVVAYLKNNCAPYKEVSIGSCDPSQPAATCIEMAPGADGAPEGMQHFQSYEIAYCNK